MKILSFVALSMALIGISGVVYAQDASLSKEDVQAIIKEYIAENPQEIMDSLDAFVESQREDALLKQEERISEMAPRLYNNDASPSIGNLEGDITVVEFFDYNCGYCKRAVEGISRLLGSDDNVKVVFKEMPILSESSQLAARYALASDKQGKYFEYHVALMNMKGPKTEESLLSLAQDVGLDTAKMKVDVNNPLIQAEIDDNLGLAASLGIQGTPGFVINDKVYRGYLKPEQLREVISDIRNDG